jgi:hypothetical protein
MCGKGMHNNNFHKGILQGVKASQDHGIFILNKWSLKGINNPPPNRRFFSTLKNLTNREGHMRVAKRNHKA